MGISKHSGQESYARRLDRVQNLCQTFFAWLFFPKNVQTPTNHILLTKLCISWNSVAELESVKIIIRIQPPNHWADNLVDPYLKVPSQLASIRNNAWWCFPSILCFKVVKKWSGNMSVKENGSMIKLTNTPKK